MRFVEFGSGDTSYFIVPEQVCCLQEHGDGTRIYLSGGQQIVVDAAPADVRAALEAEP